VRLTWEAQSTSPLGSLSGTGKELGGEATDRTEKEESSAAALS
jgi:hypothetical protein